MKKWFKYIAVIIILGCIWIYAVSDHMTEYVISSNRAGTFDDGIYGLPDDCEADIISEPRIKTIKEIYGVVDVLPYYPLKVKTGESFIDVKSYTSVSKFNKALKKQNILKNYNNKTGLYISEDVYEKLSVSDDGSVNLSVSVPALVQIVSKESKNINSNIKYQMYEVSDYIEVEVAFKIQGVYQCDNSSFFKENSIIISYEESSEIDSMVNRETIEVPENKEIWQPNCFIIQIENGQDIEQTGKSITQAIHDFVIENYSYSDEEKEIRIF